MTVRAILEAATLAVVFFGLHACVAPKDDAPAVKPVVMAVAHV
jgi:hypothetical protein